MSKFYWITNLPGLDGLVVESSHTNENGFVQVDTLINPNAILGDRQVKFPIPSGALWIHPDHLKQVIDPNKSFSTESPFGEFQFEGRLKRDRLVVDYVSYDNAITITIREDDGKTGKTVYTQNFFYENAPVALGLVEEVLKGKQEIDELVFSLKELKSQEIQENN
jgi:hypothetical protein